jgi:hypothetical protein
MKFPVTDTNPMKVFGLPKTIATEVRSHHTRKHLVRPDVARSSGYYQNPVLLFAM